MVTRRELDERRREILAIAERYGARDVRIIGSVARGDQQAHSDLDLLVHFEKGRSLFDQGGLLMDLRDLLGVEVDVISDRGLRPGFRERVSREAVPL